MDNSPSGREIRVVDGDHGTIVARGTDIQNLGAQMIGSAGVLRVIAEGADGQEGLSIEKIREVVGQIHEELDLAGRRYEPSGLALVNYGRALESSQIAMRPLVDSCQTLWSAYTGAESAASRAERSDIPGASSMTPEQLELAEQEHDDDVAAAGRAADDAYDAFIAEARRFDSAFDTWESAFDAAADAIGEATDGGVSDGGWDHFDNFVEGALVVLQVVGIILAIAAFVIGGPLIALLGALVALATLALTLYKAGRGNAEPWEIAVAVIGVIPFGSLAKFGGGAAQGFTAIGSDMIGGLGTAAGRADIFYAATRMGSTWNTARVFGASGWNAFVASARGSSAIDDVAARIMGQAFASDAASSMASGGWGVLGMVSGHYGWIVNSPGQLALVGIQALQNTRQQQTVDTWEAQLAAS